MIDHTALRVCFFVSVSFALAALPGCTGTRKLAAYEERPLPRLERPFEVQEIVILDQRTDVTSREMTLPVLSVPRTYRKHVPALTDAHKSLMETTIREHTTGRGTPVNAVITIQEAYKEFSKGWATEKERGVASLHVTFYDSSADQPVAAGAASGDFFVQSLDATPRKMERVYQGALRNVLYECVKLLHQPPPANGRR